MSEPEVTPTDPYGFTATEQAARDISSALRGIRNPTEAPRVIQSMVLRLMPDGDDASTMTWFDHASRPHQLPATCKVRFVYEESGLVLVDVAAMMAELVAGIERVRLELNPVEVAVEAVAWEMAA